MLARQVKLKATARTLPRAEFDKCICSKLDKPNMSIITSIPVWLLTLYCGWYLWLNVLLTDIQLLLTVIYCCTFLYWLYLNVAK